MCATQKKRFTKCISLKNNMHSSLSIHHLMYPKPEMLIVDQGRDLIWNIRVDYCRG